MLRRVTHGTFKDSIIFAATVVLPDAEPPHIPIINGLTCFPLQLYQGGLPAV